jgi:protein-disulfide isomerase
MDTQPQNRNVLIGGLLLLLIAAAFTIGALWQQLQNKGDSTEPNVAGTQTTTKSSKTRSISVDESDPVLGDKDAPITIIEISDFQCPYCANFEAQTFDQLKKAYIDSGKAKLVYRDLPLTQIGHRNAPKAAEAAQCAQEQGKFWEYHHKLFAEQDNWSKEQDPTALLKGYADDLGLNESFATCLDDGKMRDRVSADARAAQQAGIRGTPTFFIGRSDTISFDTAATREDPYYYLEGKIVGVGGALPFDSFKQLIDNLP